MIFFWYQMFIETLKLKEWIVNSLSALLCLSKYFLLSSHPFPPSSPLCVCVCMCALARTCSSAGVYTGQRLMLVFLSIAVPAAIGMVLSLNLEQINGLDWLSSELQDLPTSASQHLNYRYTPFAQTLGIWTHVITWESIKDSITEPSPQLHQSDEFWLQRKSTWCEFGHFLIKKSHFYVTRNAYVSQMTLGYSLYNLITQDYCKSNNLISRQEKNTICISATTDFITFK